MKEEKGNRRTGKCRGRGVKLWERGEWKEGKEEGGGGRRREEEKSKREGGKEKDWSDEMGREEGEG